MTTTPTPPEPTKSEIVDLANWWSRGDEAHQAANLGARLTKRAARLHRAKRILPIAGIVILAIVLLWPAVLPSLPTTAWKNGAELAMFDLTYRGTSDKGQPFSVTADKATRSAPLTQTKPVPGGPPAMIDLTAPRAQLLNEDGSTVSIGAQTGAYNENSEGLNLNGGVRVQNSAGTQLDASTLSVDFNQNRAWTDQPVKASGDFGTVTGQGMQLEDGGKTIIFTGQSHATLNGAHPGAKEEDEPASSLSPNAPVTP